MEVLRHATTWRSHDHFFDDYKSISIRWKKAPKKSNRKENNILVDYIITETFKTTGTQLMQESFLKTSRLNTTLKTEWNEKDCTVIENFKAIYEM